MRKKQIAQNMKRLSLFFIVFTLLQNPMLASNIDSLLLEVKVSKEDKHAEIYNKLALIYARSYSLDTAKIYAEKALNLALKFHNDEEQANAYYNFGVIYYSSNLTMAIHYKRKASEIFEKLGDLESYATCINDIGCYYTDLGKPAEALRYLFKSYDINKEKNYTKHQVENLINIGIVYYNALDYENALQLYQKAIPLAEKSGYEKIFFTLYNNISSVYSGWGKHDSAIIYCQKALREGEKINNKDKIATAYNNIGYEYMVWKKYDEAMEFFQLALKIDKEINYELSIASDYSNIGLIYFYKEDQERAMEYFKMSYELAKKMGTPYYMALNLGNMGKVLQKQGRHKEALKNIILEIELIEKNNIAELSLRAYLQLGSVYMAVNDYDKCLEAFYKSNALAKKTNQRDALMDSYRLISEAYKLKGMTDSALTYFEYYTLTKDSIFTTEQNMQLAEFQVKYDLIKKDKEIDTINLEKHKVIIQKKVLIFSLVISLSVMLTVLFILIKKYKQNRKLVAFLTLQKKELEKRMDLLEKNDIKQESFATWNLSEEAILDVYQHLTNFVTESRIYLSDELTLNMLSQKCKLQVHHISKAVNAVTNSNFNDFINSLRITEAKERLKNRDFALFTIEAIGRSVGFKSRTSFIAAFKKFENITPSEYKKAIEMETAEQLLN